MVLWCHYGSSIGSSKQFWTPYLLVSILNLILGTFPVLSKNPIPVSRFPAANTLARGGTLTCWEFIDPTPAVALSCLKLQLSLHNLASLHSNSLLPKCINPPRLSFWTDTRDGLQRVSSYFDLLASRTLGLVIYWLWGSLKTSLKSSFGVLQSIGLGGINPTQWTIFGAH